MPSRLAELNRKLAFDEITVEEYRLQREAVLDDLGEDYGRKLEGMLINDSITVEEYLKEKKNYLESIEVESDEDPVRELDTRFKDTYLSPEEYSEKRMRIQEAVEVSARIRVPTGRLTIIGMRLMLATITIFGIYFIILPGQNYYSRIATVLYIVMIVGGLYQNSVYKPPPKRITPTVSIVIPVYNGADVIYDMLKNLVLLDYPKEKYEIVVANDGSTDNTEAEIRRIILDYRETNIRLLSHFPNRGKRYTINNAVKQTRGDIIARADADTFVHSDALIKLVQHFQDEEIGGVTGWTKVKNRDQNMVTKLQEVRYNIGFKLLYPFHNLLGSVFCLPGSFTAYRRTIVENVIDEWSITVPKYSEDRQMAHLIMESGFKTQYASEAVCETIVPDTFRGYLKQQYRWGKANTIQQLRASTFMFRLNWKLWFVYLSTYFISLATPFAIIRLFIIDVNWFRWLLLAFGAALFRGMIVQGLSWSAFYAIPMYVIHVLMDVWKVPLALATIGTEENR
jgi:cellulose synthase/poly-beta-1,6-N-acetylglucosamine synthase-like glycosyltransferase